MKGLASILGLTPISLEESPNRLMFLSFFIKPRLKDFFTKNGKQWRAILGKSPEDMIRLFLEKSIIERASVAERLNEKYKINELRALLKEKGMTQSGNKDELINRLLGCDLEGMEKLTAKLELYKCSRRLRVCGKIHPASRPKEKRCREECPFSLGSERV